MPRGHLSRDLLAHSSSRTPYDNKSFILRPCHPVEESVRLSQAEYKILQRFYPCSVQSNVQTKSAQHWHEDIFMRHQHLCRSSEVLGWSARDSRLWLLAFHSGALKEQRYLGIWDLSRKEKTFRWLWLRSEKGRTQGTTLSKLEWMNWSRNSTSTKTG